MQDPAPELYFIALIPSDAICREVTAFKEDMAASYSSNKALRILPHITLKAPFKVTPQNDAAILAWFKSLAIITKPFTIVLDGFGTFDNIKNPVIFIKPLVSPELKQLQAAIIHGFTLRFPEIPLHFHEQHYHPHITVAYRDLAYTEFEKAWEVYQHKPYKANYICNCFCLLKHSGQQWEVIAEHTL